MITLNQIQFKMITLIYFRYPSKEGDNLLIIAVCSLFEWEVYIIISSLLASIISFIRPKMWTWYAISYRLHCSHAIAKTLLLFKPVSYTHLDVYKRQATTTIVSFVWDATNDWDLLHFKSHNYLLRDKLIFTKKVYYTCLPINFILRCTWIFYISPKITQTLLGNVNFFILIFGML